MFGIIDETPGREGWFPALLITRLHDGGAKTPRDECAQWQRCNAPARVATRITVYVLVALALAAGLHAPAAGFLSILRVGHPS